MVDMKLSQEERNESMGVMAEKPEYPYGLRISLCDDDLEKLNLPLPAVDQTVLLTCRAKVVSVSSYHVEGGDREDSCSLQITEMEIGKEKGDMAQKLYGGSGG